MGKACAEVGFYRMDPQAFVLDDSPHFEPEVIEQHLSQFEHAAATGVHKLVQTGLADITNEDWYHLVNHIALQTVRGNRFREDLQGVICATTMVAWAGSRTNVRLEFSRAVVPATASRDCDPDPRTSTCSAGTRR
ncbi:hypothetical protein Kfla_5785 [Kribbella flavida DSM 17836]|uniref:Uncharacterized protein n=1 Tax=Kribbella flavida (strain DSM 17836 / JCM 10339 / NBRC 14399) TaxID=479435 RepID=D2PQ87_KRIFD|nr:hypothetical protein Kfla_5785 [Kribbella flavida DSM 17836]